MSRYLVTGASGGLGSRVIEFLSQRVPAERIVALTRDPDNLRALPSKGIQIRKGDYFDPQSLDRAFQQIDKLLLISALAFTDAVAQHANVIRAAQRAGVRHVVYTAIQRSEASGIDIPQVTEWDRKTEDLLQSSGLEWTILRNTMYLDVLPLGFGRDVTETGIRVPAGEGAASLATRRDLAEGIAVVLSGEGHEGKSYTLGGSDGVSMSDIASVISEVTGKEIDYRDTSVDDFVSARVKEGFPEPAAIFFASWFRAIAAGNFATITGDLERLLNRSPQSAQDFFSEVYRG